MKRFITMAIFIAAILSFQSHSLAADALKIGVLDLQECINKSNEGKRVFQALKAKHDSLQKSLDEKQNELAQLQKQMEKQSMMLSLDAKEDKQKEFERKRRDLGYLLQDMNEEMNKAEADARQNILKDLEGIVKTIAQRENYQMILEKRSGGIMFSSDLLDITDQVIKEYNKVKP